MEIRELVKKLRNCGGGTEGIKLVNEAADKIEWLQKLVDDMTNDHFVDTLDFYADRCEKLEALCDELSIRSGDACMYCENYTPCMGNKCPLYMSSKGVRDDKGNKYDWDWSCKDFEFGTCDMLENTPCNGCIDNDYEGFKLKIGDINDGNGN